MLNKNRFFLAVLAGLVAQSLESTHAVAAEICVAQKVSTEEYVSKLHYRISCGEEVIETPAIITSVFFPVPYKWNEVAKKKVTTLMTELGFRETGVIERVSVTKRYRYGFGKWRTKEVVKAFGDPVFIFSDGDEEVGYCGVVQSNARAVGPDATVVSDYKVSCNRGSVRKILDGYTDPELSQFMKDLGADFVAQTQYVGKEGQGERTLLIYEILD